MPVATTDLQQSKTGTMAADLIQKVVQLTLNSLFKRLVGGQIFAVSKIPDPDRLSGVYECVTELHELCRWETTLRLGKDSTIRN
jgi:hypothetical protein